MRATRDAAAAKARAFLDGIKDVPCMDCGNKFPPCAMDFDHVRGAKLFDIGRGKQRNRPELVAEIAKCDVVCANCHRIRTAERRV
jgi:hypothetical protein